MTKLPLTKKTSNNTTTQQQKEYKIITEMKIGLCYELINIKFRGK